MHKILAATFLLLGSATGAFADPYWSAISTSCVPDAVSIQSNRYRPVADSAVQHQAGNVDLVVLICGVAPNAGATLPNALSMTYLDATGNSTSAQVTARLIRVLHSNGARTAVATVSSDSSLATAVANAVSAKFAHALNFNASYYYVRIDIDRTTTAEAVRSIGLTLETIP